MALGDFPPEFPGNGQRMRIIKIHFPVLNTQREKIGTGRPIIPRMETVRLSVVFTIFFHNDSFPNVINPGIARFYPRFPSLLLYFPTHLNRRSRRMISPKLQDAVNEQINKELFSEYLYLQMQAWCLDHDLEGFANWMDVQTKEERVHAMKFYNFLNDRGGTILLKPIDGPRTDYKTPEDLFAYGLEHEKFVTARINALMDLAIKEGDH